MARSNNGFVYIRVTPLHGHPAVQLGTSNVNSSTLDCFPSQNSFFAGLNFSSSNQWTPSLHISSRARPRQLISYSCSLVNWLTHQRVCLHYRFYTNRESITDYSTQAFTHWVQIIPGKVKDKKQCEDVPHKGKNHENKSLVGPLKEFGGPREVWGPQEVSR